MLAHPARWRRPGTYLLPGAIRSVAADAAGAHPSAGHPKAEVRQTQQRRNWVYSMLVDTDIGTYNMFFELRRSREKPHDLEMIVESAYARLEPPGTLGSIGFVLLCGKVYRGDPVATKR